MIIGVQLRQPTTTIVNNLRSNLTRLCRLFYNVSHWYAHTTCTPVGTVLECRVQRSNESTCALRIWRKRPSEDPVWEGSGVWGIWPTAMSYSVRWLLDFTQFLGFEFVGFKRCKPYRVAASKLDWNLQVWDHGSQQKKGMVFSLQIRCFVVIKLGWVAAPSRVV